MEAEVFERLADQETRHWWFRGRRQILHSIIKRHVPGNREVRILEAGCGTGGNLEMLSGFGKVDAFELDEQACEMARAKGFSVSNGALPEAHPFTARSFDLIVLFDVLEHVEQDRESLAALRKLLAPGGILLMTVPAFPFLWSAHDVKHHHFRRYRRPELRGKLENAGFSISRISYFNFWLFPVVAGVRVVKKLLGSGHSDEEGVPPRFFNVLLRFIFASERFLLSVTDLPFGVSLLAIASGPDD